MTQCQNLSSTIVGAFRSQLVQDSTRRRSLHQHFPNLQEQFLEDVRLYHVGLVADINLPHPGNCFSIAFFNPLGKGFLNLA